MNTFYAGTARRAMRLPEHYPMSGFILRQGPSEGVHDPLLIRAAYFTDGVNRAFIVALDLMAVRSDFAMQLAARIERECGVDADAAVICCTHTHSGPDCMARNGESSAYKEWMRRLSDDIIACVKDAVSLSRPAEITAYTGEVTMQVNRVLEPHDGSKKQKWETLNWDERSDAELERFAHILSQTRDRLGRRSDPALVALRISREGLPDDFIVNYSCHPVSLGPENRLYSADYPGCIEASLNRDFPGATVLFINGSCGDMNPVRRGSFESAKANGEAIAQVVRALVREGGRRVNGSVSYEARQLTLEYETDYDAAELARRMERYARNYTATAGEGMEVEHRIYGAYLAWAKTMTKRMACGEWNTGIETSLKLVRVGEVTFAAVPFELFSGVGRAIRKTLSQQAIVCGYAGGDFGYLISRDMFGAAKYERFEAYKFMMLPGPVGRDAEGMLLCALSGGERIKLCPPSETFREAAKSFLLEYEAAGERAENGTALLDKLTYDEWLENARRNVSKETARPDWTAENVYFACRESDGEIVGMTDVRHSLSTPFLREYGGHIGFTVRPTQRNKGYATVLLNLALKRARELGLERVMLGCYCDNIASKRTIERCGGVLIQQKPAPDGRGVDIYEIEA